MRLKLSGPDYKDKDPVEALVDFKERVTMYQKHYVPLGDYEEKNDMPYVQVSFSNTYHLKPLLKIVLDGRRRT